MSKVCYVDLGVVPIDGAEYVSEITWLVESGLGLVPHHYFVDYPGAKDLERLIVEVVGGTTLTRYSYPTVLKTFLSDIPKASIVAFKDEKQRQLFKALLSSLEVRTDKKLCTYDDVVSASASPETMLSVISLVDDTLSQAKNAASKVFGNSI